MLPLSVEDSKKSDDVRLPRPLVYETILIVNVLIIYISSMLTQVSFHYRVPLVGLVTLVSLFIFFRPFGFSRIPRWIQTLLLPLLIGGACLIGLVVVAKNVPAIAFKHTLLQDVSLTPAVPMDGTVSISVVIPARNEENPLLINTVRYLFIETPDVLLKEIIIVDDESEERIDGVIDTEFPDPAQRSKIQLIRLDTRQGLTNAKTIGAERSSGTHILFLDGHCRVAPNYAERMLARSLSGSPRDIIVPEVITVEGDSFNFKSMNGGIKMMFEWNFEFSWFDNNKTDDDVPVSSGGILLMTRKEFLNGRYDRGMLEWGGENIEQSLRAWMCGGRVIVERQAKIGHVFQRKLRPGRVNVSTVERNHARAAFVWLDDWLKYFEERHKRGNLMLSDMGPYIDERLELRHRLKCGTFDVFVDKFRKVFDQRSLFVEGEVSLQDDRSGLCVTGKQLNQEGKPRDRKVQLVWEYCQMYDNRQRFGPVIDGTRIRSPLYERCISRNDQNELTIAGCDVDHKNVKQDWKLIHGKLHSNLSGQPGGQVYCILSPSGNSPKVGSQVTVGLCDASPDSIAHMHSLYPGIDRE
jgi:polypeptide N-acetylgalactosaminyltransferase